MPDESNPYKDQPPKIPPAIIEMKPEQPPEPKVEKRGVLHDYGQVAVLAIYKVVNGKPKSSPYKAIVKTPHNEIVVRGRNCMATAHVVLDSLVKNIIND